MKGALTMKKEKCAIYLRYSSKNQNENSIQYQREAIKRYCERNGYEIVEEFVDRAQSATNVNREAFQKMRNAIKSDCEWGKLLVFDFSRLFRNKNDASTYKGEIRDADVQIISVTEPFSETEQDSFLEGLMDLLNEHYSRDNAKKTHAGQSVKASLGFHCGGTPPLGYDVDKETKRLKINKIEEAIVKEIFRMVLAGFSYQQMADKLNERGWKTKIGKPFTKDSFHDLLKQRKYIGTYTWNLRKAKGTFGKLNNHAYKPKEKHIIVENVIPPIIPKKDFDKVQELMASRQNGKATSKNRRHYMLTGMGILKCGQCGVALQGHAGKSHQKEYITYRCPNHEKQRGESRCPTKDIKMNKVDHFVTCILLKELCWSNHLEELNNLLKGKLDSDEVKLEKNRLKTVKRQLSNLANAFAKTASETILEKIEQLEKEKRYLEESLARIDITIPKLDKDILKQVRRKLKTYFKKSDDLEVKELL